jgi:hypothetical protein
VTACSLNINDLSKEFDVSKDLMDAFISKFAPCSVAPDTYRDDSDVMLFIHIPKTAGVSVGKSFHSAFDEFHGIQWDNISHSFRQATRAATYNQSRMKKRQVIIGHYGWPEIQIWRNHEMPTKCGTIFRDPVTRMISNYNYNCSSAHPANKTFLEKFPTLDEYIGQIPLDVQLTQAIGLACSFENILTKLIRYYTFLGTTENLSASLRHLSLSHGLPRMTEHRENLGQNKNVDQCSPELKKMILRRSYNDEKIHRLLARIFEA